MLIDVLSTFVIVIVGLLYGWDVAALLGVVVLPLGVWWKLGPFWTREQRLRIRRRAQQRAGDRQA
ncbi:hypothetical protein GCM10009767_06040 [Kocuria aegyptia]|uniref:Uncharacterized protein n=1 Tax=Kocuria aegyptia TaxID=330943 RepID=A0ABP4WDY0_9MICC